MTKSAHHSTASARILPSVASDTGKSLIPLIMQLTEWALKNIKGVMSLREEYEKAAMTR